jgi:N-acetylmuramoyl-L-alanine amidase
MPFHTARQGECFSSIAKQYGFANWRTIYDHPENAALRQKRPNPNTLAPGDVIFIPAKQVKQEQAQTGTTHEFTRTELRTRLRIVLKDSEYKPIGDKRYRLAIDGNATEGTTSSDGLLEQLIPEDAMAAELTLWFDESTHGVWKLNVGALDPVDVDSGVRSRLRNLGYPCEGDEMTEGLRAFQTREKIEVTGKVDDATRTRLTERHDRLN